MERELRALLLENIIPPRKFENVCIQCSLAADSKVAQLSSGLKEYHCTAWRSLVCVWWGRKKSSESQCFSNVWIEGSNRPWRADAGEQELCFNPLSPGLTFNVKKEMDDGAESSFLAQEFGGCTVNFELEQVWGRSGFAGGCLWNNKSFTHYM